MAWSSAMKTRMLAFRSCSLVTLGPTLPGRRQPDLDGHHRATSGRRRQGQRAAQRARAFAHAAQTEGVRLEAVGRRDAAAIIADGERQVLALAAQGHGHAGGAGVFRDIRQRFLEDAEQRRGMVRVELDIVSRRCGRCRRCPCAFRIRAPAIRARRRCPRSSVGGRRSSEMRCTASMVRSTRSSRYPPFRAGRLVRRQAVGQHRQRHLDRREVAAQVVVDLARDAGAFLFLDLLDVVGQLGQARARGARISSCSSLLAVMLVMMPSHCTPPPSSGKRRGAQVDPLDVVPGFDPDPAFPVPAAQVFARGAIASR
jgi:hypothetical protein